MMSSVARWTPAQGRAAARMSWVTATTILALGLGFILRVAAAQGALGLDEAWSLRAAVRLPSLGDAFWGLPHDNNHPINTIWMALLGSDRPEWAYRLPAVLLGTLTIGAIARTSAHAGRAAVVCGAVLAAVSLPLVDFGSEARGYAGLTLASVIAIALWRRAVEPGPGGTAPSPWWLAATTLLGALNHLAMGLTLAVLGGATMILFGLRRRRATDAFADAVRLFAPCALALVPVAAFLLIAVTRHSLKIGDVDPFAIRKLLTGMGNMTAMTVGLPASPASPAFMLVVLLCLGRAAQRGLLSLPSAALCLSAIPVLLVGLALLRVPNTGYPRYFAICGIVLLLSVAEIAGRLWEIGGRTRRLTMAGMAATVLSSLLCDATAIHTGRSAARETLLLMGAGPQATWATDRPVMAQLLLGAVVAERTPPLVADPSCTDPPNWYLAVGTFDSRPNGSLALDLGRCVLDYRVRATFTSNPLSGTQWTLYRRAL